MRQKTSGLFTPQIPGVYNTLDCTDQTFYHLSPNQTIGPGVTTQKTIGASCVCSPSLGGPSPSQKWTIESVSFLSYASIFDSSANLTTDDYPIFGRLGAIKAGLILDQQFPTGRNTLVTFPPDQTLITNLWDPTQDELLPIYPSLDVNYNQNAKIISATIVPPISLDLTAGIVTPSLGLWIMPSILGNELPLTATSNPLGGSWEVGIMLLNSQYAINYDDGL